jgi:exopolyphosphatase/pppGpp-phosphohydrolase
LPVAAVDIGSNSTRLLIAEGEDELARESILNRPAR